MERTYSIFLLVFCIFFASCGDGTPKSEEPPVLQSVFEEGWHDPESSEGDRWRWSNGDATIELVNRGSSKREVILRFAVRSLIPRTLDLRLEGRSLSNEVLASDVWVTKEIPVMLSVGSTTLSFTSPEPGAQPPADERSLYVCVRNFEMARPSDRSPER